MRATMHAVAPDVTARSIDLGHADPMVRDVTAELAARAHADGEPDDQAAVARGAAPSRRTANRWRKDGRGSPADLFAHFLMNTRDTFRWVAHVKAISKRAALLKLARAELIDRYREIRGLEKLREAENTALDLTPGACWLDRAAASERDAALDEEKAAIERRFAELRVTDAEVWGCV